MTLLGHVKTYIVPYMWLSQLSFCSSISMHGESREVQYVEYCEMGDMDCLNSGWTKFLSVVTEITGENAVDTLNGVNQTAGVAWVMWLTLQAGQAYHGFLRRQEMCVYSRDSRDTLGPPSLLLNGSWWYLLWDKVGRTTSI